MVICYTFQNSTSLLTNSDYMAKEFSVCISGKTGCLQESVNVKEEVCIKEEIEWDSKDNTALAELYAGHNVKDEIVLGPETVQVPDFATTHSSCDVSNREVLDTCKSAQNEQISRLKTCVVKLEYDANLLHKCHPSQKTCKDNLSHTIHMKAHEAKDIQLIKPKYTENNGQSSSCHTEHSDYSVAETKYNINKEKNIFTNENNFSGTHSTQTKKADIKKNRNSILKSEAHSENENHVAKVANQFVLNINNETNEETNSQAKPKRNKKLKLNSDKHSENDDQAARLANYYDYDPNINNQIEDKASSHELPNTCQICNKSFSGKNNLIRHSKLHTGQKLYKCKICNKQFARIDYLRTHERIHSKQKVYSCEYCYKEFSDSSNYNKHRRFHRDVKRYTCEFCGKQFGQAIHLSTHHLTHTREKPYQCKTCKKQFAYKHRLKAHERLHIGRKPYGCQLCSKRFIAQCRLSRHEILIHKTKLSFDCELCQKQFKKKAEMIYHIFNSH